ncbi:MarR family winged helix-turn-helix transcriptional regulator [Lysobacter sp. A421]
MSSPAPCNGATLGLLFRQIRDAMWAKMAQELAAAGHELTFSQYATFKRLAQSPAGATELARIVDLDPGAMSRLLDKLEARGLITRTADPHDGRARQILMTPAGQTMWKDVNHCGQRIREHAMAGLDSSEREQLFCLLNRVRKNLSPTEP